MQYMAELRLPHGIVTAPLEWSRFMANDRKMWAKEAERGRRGALKTIRSACFWDGILSVID
jgi:hypothetical protein